MGRETKVGLLVGMCFIVCFAIILSRRSERPTDPQPMTFEIATVLSDAPAVGLDADTAARELPASAPAVTRRVVPMTPPPAPSTAPQVPLRRPPVQTQEQDDSAVASGTRVPNPREALADSSPDLARDADRFERRTTPITPPAFLPDGVTTNLSNRPLIADDPGGRSAPLRLNMPGRAGEVWAAATPLPQAAPDETQVAVQDVPSSISTEPDIASAPAMDLRVPDEPRAELARYVVQKGDTLSKIAREHYGTQRPEVVKALYEANRSVLPNPNTIIAGKELMVPVLGEVSTDDLPAALAEITQGPGQGSEVRVAEAGADRPSSLPLPAVEEPSPDAGTTGTEQMAGAAPGPEEETVAPGEALAEASLPAPPEIHVVAPGENLSKIARRHYGSDAKTVIDALQDANRRQVKDKDRLVVGTKLVLPAMKERSESSARPNSALVAVTVPELRETPAERSASKAWYWYTLKPGECYTTVAAKKLGTSKRWSELADLNRDIFPDAKKIRSGVRIRVPRDGETQGTTGSERDSA